MSLNQMWQTSGRVTNLHQAYNSPEFRRKLNDLQQSKYRQGLRNATDTGGNQIYVADDYDKIVCLPQHLQVQARTELERIERLKIRAEPFDFEIQVSTTEYILKLRDKKNASHRYGPSSRILPIREVESKPSPEHYLFSLIDQMKSEVGCHTDPVDVDARMAELQKKIAASMSVPEPSSPFRMKDSRKRKPSPRPQCKEHGNVLEPRGEGVLACPIDGCTVAMRKKTSGAAFRKPEVKEPQSSEEAQIEDEVKAASKVIEDLSQLEQAFQKSLTNQIVGTTQIRTSPIFVPGLPAGVAGNDNKPELFQSNGRTFIRQNNNGVGSTGWSYVDVTSIVAGTSITLVRPGEAQFGQMSPLVLTDPGTTTLLALKFNVP